MAGCQPHSLWSHLPTLAQDMEKHGRLICCIQELRQMLATPIKPYNRSSSPNVRKTPEVNPDPPVGSGDEEDESKQQSSSDSELEELLARDFPHEDLPSLITRAMGKGGYAVHVYLYIVCVVIASLCVCICNCLFVCVCVNAVCMSLLLCVCVCQCFFVCIHVCHCLCFDTASLSLCMFFACVYVFACVCVLPLFDCSNTVSVYVCV